MAINPSAGARCNGPPSPVTPGNYLEALFEAQGATLVGSPEEADIRMCVGRSDEEDVVSLFDEGFFIG